MSEEKKIGISNSDRAHVLVQAMPYIKKWAGETIVVKYGGNAMINPELKEAVMNDIVLMQLVGVEKDRKGKPLCRRYALHRRGDDGHCAAGAGRQSQ